MGALSVLSTVQYSFLVSAILIVFVYFVLIDILSFYTFVPGYRYVHGLYGVDKSTRT